MADTSCDSAFSFSFFFCFFDIFLSVVRAPADRFSSFLGPIRISMNCPASAIS